MFPNNAYTMPGLTIGQAQIGILKITVNPNIQTWKHPKSMRSTLSRYRIRKPGMKCPCYSIVWGLIIAHVGNKTRKWDFVLVHQKQSSLWTTSCLEQYQTTQVVQSLFFVVLLWSSIGMEALGRFNVVVGLLAMMRIKPNNSKQFNSVLIIKKTNNLKNNVKDLDLEKVICFGSFSPQRIYLKS